jgi:hypothetical protein
MLTEQLSPAQCVAPCYLRRSADCASPRAHDGDRRSIHNCGISGHSGAPLGFNELFRGQFNFAPRKIVTIVPFGIHIVEQSTAVLESRALDVSIHSDQFV